MGFFSKKKTVDSEMPMLPQLPRLPDFPNMEGDFSERSLHQLPSFPSNSFGTKFSRDAVKDAVSGDESGERNLYSDESSGDEMRMMQEPLRRPFAEESEEEMEERFPEMPTSARRGLGGYRAEAEPVFVRIDKFEEGLKLFETVKDQISAIERALVEIRKVKEREEAELSSWENELRRMKEEVEKISMNLFSKV